MKDNSVRMFPYGGYDPFSTPSAKVFSQTHTPPDRPPYSQAPVQNPQQAYAQGFNQPYMPYMPPMMPPGVAPHPMMQGMPGMPGMQGMPFGQQQQQGNQNASMQTNNNQGTGFTFSKAMGGANQVMGLAQQMGNILSFFK
ncbi:hypothetical protein KUV80_04365 [Fictibacillus nanhaiensis]|uniref:hypothetical protein n=1 Tax=Fictibacillus nanhaiensis TaxID=742169 RepID=UPI001C97FB1B|nr:hypothetical protein [Fictibacillus nanhaiensis]MBY6035870.1 hypothetical protein [Fictibacillus nanhaiensis]